LPHSLRDLRLVGIDSSASSHLYWKSLMKKLKLSLDSLRITSFSTFAAERGNRGTVHGRSDTSETGSPIMVSQVCTVFTNEFSCQSGYHICVGGTNTPDCLHG
jgi:hypothetical protein